MVHIKRLELTNFKSFGGTATIPLLPGFTVVSGPNGSGKSNILDALLFALGLSTSKGMRAERLPDLVNNSQNRSHTIETVVTVTFDLSGYDHSQWEDEGEVVENTVDEEAPTNEGEKLVLNSQELVTDKEWTITRKLRVTKQGTYTSTYYINGDACTQTELHEQLNRLRIYPEGYNVVLQGDVTSIISMNGKERREIIDELAGVAQFDRKIVLAKDKLDAVKEQEDRSRIVETELVAQRDRLSADKIKAEKYQKIRIELQEKLVWEAVLRYSDQQQQEWKLREQIEASEREHQSLNSQLQTLTTQIHQATEELKQLDASVKALGEDELLALQANLNSQTFEQRQLEQRQEELVNSRQQIDLQLSKVEQEIQESHRNLDNLGIQKSDLEAELIVFTEERDRALLDLTQSRENANSIAATAEVWMQQQTEIHRQIEGLQKTIEPQKTEQATLQERYSLLTSRIGENNQQLAGLIETIKVKSQQLPKVDSNDQSHPNLAELTKAVTEAEQELQLQQDTQTRLLNEQREKHRQLDKLEAQMHAIQEATGSHASKLIMQSKISGICGLVAQLGKVEPRYQLALEISAGTRLGYIVVESDAVAAAGIELLKQKRGGRATFLPLNKMQKQNFGQKKSTANKATQRHGDAIEEAQGFIDYAINLLDFDPRYQDIFGYVFGNTVVFNNLDNARRFIGQHRIVTLDGEILESSGAMTGGSANMQSSLHFGTVDETEDANLKMIESMQQRLQEIEQILQTCQRAIEQAKIQVKERGQALMIFKQNNREQELKLEQVTNEVNNLKSQEKQLKLNLVKLNDDLAQTTTRLTALDRDIPTQESQLQELRQTLAQLETSNSHSEWQIIQTAMRNQEAILQNHEQELRQAQQNIITIETQQKLISETLKQAYQRLEQYQGQQVSNRDETNKIIGQLAGLKQQIAETKSALAQVEARLGSAKQQRDLAEGQLREQHLHKQQLEWQQEKLQETQAERRQQLATLREQLAIQKAELPDPLPSVPDDAKLGELEKDVKNLQKRLQSLEPVNMLALEEYEHTQARLTELTEKLATLEAERTEILLRIENFTTLRQRAFHEAFNAVNQNFQTIFAELSDGDGYLQLDNPEDPFSGGLNLVAHPKGKPVQRLASMSGGEKSLTALSFIFSLQRYRPSTFYAFDEVDMFLDGANVEKLSRMIKRQAEQAQFIVVSLRRPMIEAAQRTIGVTQARGAYTQVLGIKLS